MSDLLRELSSLQDHMKHEYENAYEGEDGLTASDLVAIAHDEIMNLRDLLAESVSRAQCAAVLNRALEADCTAVSALMLHHVPCNDAIRKDETIQVGRMHDDPTAGFEVGPLGIINGIFGVRPNLCGYIVCELDHDTSLVTRFYAVDDDGKEIK